MRAVRLPVFMLLLMGLLSAACVLAAPVQPGSLLFDDSHQSLAEWVQATLSSEGVVGPTVAKTFSQKCTKLKKQYSYLKMASSCGHYPNLYRSSLECCESEAEERDMLTTSIAGSTSVGQCFMSRGPTYTYKLSDSVSMDEHYLITCNLAEKAHACAPAGCDDLVLSSQGPTYVLSKVITDTEPIQPPSDDCPGSHATKKGALTKPAQKNAGPSSKAQLAASPATTNTTALHSEAAAGSGNATAQQAPAQPAQVCNGGVRVWATGAYVFSGPMQVTSRTYETKYREGWFTFTVPRDGGKWECLADILAEEADMGKRYPRVAPEDWWKYELEFYSTKDELYA